jgi:hypothetical protein
MSALVVGLAWSAVGVNFSGCGCTAHWAGRRIGGCGGAGAAWEMPATGLSGRGVADDGRGGGRRGDDARCADGHSAAGGGGADGGEPGGDPCGPEAGDAERADDLGGGAVWQYRCWCRPGTINILVSVPVPLGDAAYVNAVMTATEAKTQALLDAGYHASGAASDALCVAAPAAGEPQDFAGPRSLWGARIARAVHSAVHAGAVRYPAQADPAHECPRPDPSRGEAIGIRIASPPRPAGRSHSAAARLAPSAPSPLGPETGR